MRALVGALRLAALDARGLSLFDPTAVGAWRSFNAWLIILPLHMLLAATQVDKNADVMALLLLSVASFAAQMAGYLLAVTYLLEGSGRGDRVALFIGTYNWSAVVGMMAFTIGQAAASGLSPPLAAGVASGTFLWVAFYSWFTVRTAVGCPGLLAAGLVVLEILVSIAVQMVVQAV